MSRTRELIGRAAKTVVTESCEHVDVASIFIENMEQLTPKEISNGYSGLCSVYLVWPIAEASTEAVMDRNITSW